MVKHSPNERLRLLQQQHTMNTNAQVHPPPALNADGPPALELPGNVADELPPVDEALRRAAEVRAEAEEQEREAVATGFTPHPNVNMGRRHTSGRRH